MATIKTSQAGNRPAKRRSDGGYTLLELLVVIAIAGLVTAALSTTVFSGRDGVTLRAAAEDLTALLKRTRGQALSQNREAAVFVDVREKVFGLESSDKRWPLPPQSEVTILTAAEEIAAEQRGAIRFFPDGSATGGGVRISQAGTSYQVSVHWLTGQISLAK